MLSEGSVSPLLKRKSRMTKSPSFWFGQLVVEGVCPKAAGAAITNRAAVRARKVIGILQMRPPGAAARAGKGGCGSAGYADLALPRRPPLLLPFVGEVAVSGADTRFRRRCGLAKVAHECHFGAERIIRRLRNISDIAPWDLTFGRPLEARSRGPPCSRPRRHRGARPRGRGRAVSRRAQSGAA